jgi:O-antigen chain-terminating methyltransferase
MELRVVSRKRVFESAPPSLDEILRILREEAAAIEVKQLREGLRSPVHAEAQQSLLNEDWPMAELADSLQIPLALTYRVESFLLLDDVGFLESAYRVLLKREADPDGIASYLEALRSGATRQDLLCDLAESEEGRRQGVVIAGLGLFRFFRHHGERVWAKGALASIKRVAARWQTLGALADQGPQRVVRLVLWLMRFQRAHQAHRHNLRVHRNEILTAVGEVRAQLQEVSARVELLHRDMATAKAEQLFALRVETAHAQAGDQTASPESSGAAHGPPTPPGEVDRFYFQFEEHCRGTQEAIKQQLSAYLGYVPRGASLRVVDLGCGRGEWLSVLSDAGFDAIGLDINPVMIDICRQKGLNARVHEAVDYLRRQQDGSHAAVSAFHLAEHLSLEVLLAITRESQRILQPGGVLIMETPNPENLLVGSHTFYHDPTHRNPLTPTFMEFLARYHGFVEIRILRLNPYPESARVRGYDELTDRVNGHMCGPQDFALLAQKLG